LALGERLAAMVLVIPPTGWEERAPQVDLYEQMARVVERRGPKALIAAAAEMPPPDPFIGSSEWVDRRAASMGGADPQRLATNFRGAAHADLPSLEQLATITTPTLVLAWSGDPGHPVSTAERLRDTMPAVEVHIASTSDEVATWGQLVADFLAAV
jgi:pimeloyl-ACP methyl ester carboxylesterase